VSFIRRGRGRKRDRRGKDVEKEQRRRRTVVQDGNTTRGGSLGGGLRGTSRTGRGTNERQRASDSARTGDTSRSKEREKGDAPGRLRQGGEEDNRGKRRGFDKEELNKEEARASKIISILIQIRLR